jgi:GT2 family glycosyltransferase
MPKLSILVVSWNTCRLLTACLQSIQYEMVAFDAESIETIVIDNGSTDGSASMMRRDFPWVRLIENSENPGFAAANNQAFALSSGEYLLLLNPDTVLRPGALITLLDFMAEHPNAGAAGSRLLNPDGSLQPSCSPSPTVAREFWHLFHLDVLYPLARYPMHKWPASTPCPVDVVQGAALIVRRVVLEQVGILDTDYFIYSEEVDLCNRIRNAGWSIYWVPQSTVVHFGGQSTQQVAAAMFLQLYHSKVLYFRKHQGSLAVQLYKAVLLLASLARLSFAPLIAIQNSSRRARQLTLAGYYLRLVLKLHKM